MKGTQTQTGFTLIELMIVVVIIGVLASIAIPNFLKFQLKSRSAEHAQLGSIHTTNETFHARWGAYVQAAATGNTSFSSQKTAWVGAGQSAFTLMGFVPTGSVLFCYDVSNVLETSVSGCDHATNTAESGTNPNDPFAGSTVNQFTAEAVADIDGSLAGTAYNAASHQGYYVTSSDRSIVRAPITSGDSIF